ncbi:MAG: nucleotidyltransferase domain-containing protein [Bacteroidetes bacterium]|nr:MAG: nucleotidyltransferase domain-containing protein [Bacteroidota bacterium]
MKPTTEKMIAKIRAYFVDKPIVRAYLFGSYSRGEEKRGSDVDLLVESVSNSDLSLWDYIEMENDLKKIIHKKVDLFEKSMISRFVIHHVEQNKKLIYER